jgi:predicted nucleic acid-binding protein
VKILVDTSVWSLALACRRRVDSAALDRLTRAIEDGDVVLLGVILQEILQAFRSERELGRAAKALAAFPLLQLSRSDYVEGARVFRRCRNAGLSPSTTDCQIAAAAAANRCAILTTDDDFKLIAERYPLELVRWE